MSLIEQARKNLSEKERLAQEQKEADVLFSQMYKDVAEILEQYGNRIRNVPGRIGLSLVYSLLFPLLRVSLRETVATPFELADKRRLETSLNGNDKTVNVTLKSGSANPSKSDSHINILIGGLENSLELHTRYAKVGFGNPDYWPSDEYRQIHVDNYQIRRAGLSDAKQWAEVADQLKQKYPTSSSSR